MSTNGRKVLITGASIAGPALGYWLSKSGFEVTLVERTRAVRAGGYAIDIRGTAIDVVERMGLLPAIRAAHVRTRQATFVNAKGKVVGRIAPDTQSLTGGNESRDVELPRGTLTSLLFDLTKDSVRYRFGEAVTSLADGPSGVAVHFRSGHHERFDLVVSAEGLHSTTRSMIFGPESRFSRYLGYCFAIGTVANQFGLRREVVIYNRPGRAAILYSTDDGPTLTVLLPYRRSLPTPDEIANRELQRQSIISAYAGDRWRVAEMVTAIQAAEDFYFDSMLQIRMPAWAKGRVALVGDAAYGPSFFSGQGTSIALVGAYVLAGALATHEDHELAFCAYERTVRPYIVANQAIARKGSSTVAPGSAAQLLLRNAMIRLAPYLKRLGLQARTSNKAYDCLSLPEYAPFGSRQTQHVR